MIEPISVVGASAVVAYLGKDGINKLLGPTADYLGQEVRGLVEKCNINIDSVFRRALRKLGHRADMPGQVSPRVLKRVLTDAPFCDDPVVQEYFAGMLASSRGDSSLDDRAVPYSNLISSLSSNQIKFHYLLYAAIRNAFLRQGIYLTTKAGRQHLGVFISCASINEVFAITSEEEAFSILEHCLYGLRQKELIAPDYAHGGPEFLSKTYPTDKFYEEGITVWPSLFGIDLWLWAHGIGGTWTHKFLEPELLSDEMCDGPSPFLARRIVTS